MPAPSFQRPPLKDRRGRILMTNQVREEAARYRRDSQIVDMTPKAPSFTVHQVVSTATLGIILEEMDTESTDAKIEVPEEPMEE